MNKQNQKQIAGNRELTAARREGCRAAGEERWRGQEVRIAVTEEPRGEEHSTGTAVPGMGPPTCGAGTVPGGTRLSGRPAQGVSETPNRHAVRLKLAEY